MHKIYSSAGNMSIYVVVFNLEWLLGKHTCNSQCDKDCERNKKDTIRFIKFWLNSIARNSNGAPVLMIGTHKDTVVSGADLTMKNVKLATSNGDIKRANDIIGHCVSGMKVYQQKQLKLHLPEQPSSLHTIYLGVSVVALRVLMHNITLQMKLLIALPLSGSTQLTASPENKMTTHNRQIRCSRSYARN